jgi:hypothetical protein
VSAERGPGRVVDEETGLRSWNDHLTFVGHLAAADATARILGHFPRLTERFDLGPAFYEHAHEAPLYDGPMWLLCGADTDGAVPVTVFVPIRRDTEDDE